MLSTKLPNASRSSSSRISRTSRNMPSVSLHVGRQRPATGRPAAAGPARPASQRLPLARVATRAARRSLRSQRATAPCSAVVEPGGVLPQVEPHGAEAERLHLAPHRPHAAGARGRGLPPPLSACSSDAQVGEQLVGRGVALRRRAVSPRFGVAQRRLEPQHHAGQVLPEDLARVPARRSPRRRRSLRARCSSAARKSAGTSAPRAR